MFDLFEFPFQHVGECLIPVVLVRPLPDQKSIGVLSISLDSLLFVAFDHITLSVQP